MSYVELKLKIAKPPVYDRALEQFHFNEQDTVFTYGDTIYNPANIPISADLAVHEGTHAKQQNFNNTDAALWWEKYFTDPDFRLKQEGEAYGQQYAYIMKMEKDRNERFRNLHFLATSLASPMYGSLIGYNGAKALIQRNAYGNN